LQTSLTAEVLPIKSDDRIDFIVFVVDVTNVKSLTEFAKSLDFVEASFFHGRCCLVYSHGTGAFSDFADLW
jgi:hypothetical protein